MLKLAIVILLKHYTYFFQSDDTYDTENIAFSSQQTFTWKTRTASWMHCLHVLWGYWSNVFNDVGVDISFNVCPNTAYYRYLNQDSHTQTHKKEYMHFVPICLSCLHSASDHLVFNSDSWKEWPWSSHCALLFISLCLPLLHTTLSLLLPNYFICLPTHPSGLLCDHVLMHSSAQNKWYPTNCPPLIPS